MIGSTVDEEKLMAAYLSAKKSGELEEFFNLLLPLTVLTVTKAAPSVQNYERDDLIAKLSEKLLTICNSVIKKDFPRAVSIIAYVNRILYTEVKKDLVSLAEEKFNFMEVADVGWTSEERGSDYAIVDAERRQWVEDWVKDNIRFSNNTRWRELLCHLIANGPGSVAGLVSREREEFLENYVLIMYRIGNAVYNQD